MTKYLLAVSAIIAISAGSAWAQGQGQDKDKDKDNNGHVTVEGVVIDYDVDVKTTVEQFMGMSMKAPPNEKAADSRGVRTETTTVTTTTTTTADVTGPKGQIDEGKYTYNNCTPSNEKTTVDIDTDFSVTGPGNRSE